MDNCPQSHLHNGQRCVNQDLVMCELPLTTAIGYPFSGDQRCNDRLDGSYGIDDCSKYLICREQQVIDIKTCPEGYRFKVEAHECVLANQVPHCSDNNSMDDNICKFKKDGHHFDSKSTDCTSYINCKNEKLISREKCGNSAVFNGEICVPTPLFTCPSTAWNNICKNKNNGFYINPINGCSSYVRCMGERAVEFNDCPNGQYFDPEEKTCIYEKFEERRKCVGQKKSADCENKSQGFYQGLKCQTYYYCFNRLKTEYKCPNDKIFNGENCVINTSYNCSEENSCAMKSDGYYKNNDGSCRSYYYCSNGHRLMYLCEEGHIFDGIKCIRGNQCDSDKICANKSDGYHADLKSNCRNYVYCDNKQKLTQLTCRNNKVFNGQKCVNSNSYTCPSQPNYQRLNCIPKHCIAKDCNQTDGFFIDIESGCKNYFFCIGGKKSILSCTTGQLFNGQLCVSEDKFICPIYCNDYEHDDFQSKNLSCPLSGH